jgi:hypothetical protein
MSFDKSQTASILINKLKIFYYWNVLLC